MLVVLHVPLRDRAAFHSASDDDDAHVTEQHLRLPHRRGSFEEG